ncbi:hypothetical protein GCM10010218_42420 [Streptomyces mashuensis]|uniref:Uncharacterized protein n=1 Tax=Streptomyces mashuensis TaxID=33904 RepID=A0A919B5C1_9ACTN|nr:hypothetical protein [Streptomyces mashuensis]GHF56601.1 hypothetical protein GCM10010218_42420 [Streptomyces mashuensis]
MTPYSLAFFLDVVTTGTVLGAGPADGPGRVSDALGADFAENCFGRTAMTRDYGLPEFYWTRESPDAPWEGHHFTVQVHRLAYGRRGAAGAVLHERYGRFPRRLPFEKLARMLERRGTPLVEVAEDPANAPYYRRFWQPRAEVAISVIGLRETGITPSHLRSGDVYSISAGVGAAGVSLPTG